MEQLDVCLTPRTIRKRRLLRANGVSNPELESLYHDRSTMVSPPVTSPYPRQSPLVTLGTPTHQQSRGTPRRLRDISNVKVNSIFGSSLPLNERLNKVIKQDSNNDHSSTSLDLSGYQIMPSKMDAAFSAAAAEPLFSRQNFFQDPPQQLATMSDSPNDERDNGDIPPQSLQIPPSPTSSITSTTTTISESVNMALLSWPGSPNDDRVKHNTGLTFGRVGSSSAPTLTFSSPPPPIVFSPAYVPPISSPLAFAQRSPKPSSVARSPSPHTSPCPSSHQKPVCLKRRIVRRSTKSATRRPTKFVARRPRLPQRWAITTISRPIRITPWKESTITPNVLA